MTTSNEAPMALVPSGYALVAESVLRAWGKLDEVRAACVFPIALAQQVPADGEWVRTPREATPQMLAQFVNFYGGGDWMAAPLSLTKRQLARARKAYSLMLAATPQAPQPVVGGFGEDDRITRADLAGTMAELVDQYDPAERAPLTDEEKAVLIDFLHGMVDAPLFLGVAGHYFAQNPVAGSTASQPQQGAVAAEDAEKAFFARDFYEDAKAGKVPWPCGTHTLALAQQVPADGECVPMEFLNGIDPNSGFYLDNYWLGLVRNDDGSVTLRNARGTPLAALAATPQAPQPVVDEDGAFEDWLGAVEDAGEIASNARDPMIARRAKRVVAWLEANKPNRSQPQQAVAWQCRYIDPDEGPGMWRHCEPENVAVFNARGSRYETRALYAHPSTIGQQAVDEKMVDAVRHRVGCHDGLDITPAQVRSALKHFIIESTAALAAHGKGDAS